MRTLRSPRCRPRAFRLRKLLCRMVVLVLVAVGRGLVCGGTGLVVMFLLVMICSLFDIRMWTADDGGEKIEVSDAQDKWHKALRNIRVPRVGLGDEK